MGSFTRYDFVAYDKLTTGLRHELSRVNQTYNSLNGPTSCRRPVVSLSYATKSYRVNRPYEKLNNIASARARVERSFPTRFRFSLFPAYG